MRKSVILLFMAFLSLAVTPAFANVALTDPPKTEAANTPNNDAESAARAEVLKNRLEEIKAMDKSEMTRSEKKALRKEVKAIKAELAANNNGIYLSVGAIIIIILLLILLL
jgi:Skp family chaperone for outer membrane proteins